MFKRIFIVVLDSVGIGAMDDANEYGDFGVNTLGNIARSQGGLFLPCLERLGLGMIAPIAGVNPVSNPQACFGKMAEVSKGKDTTTGHWELGGCPVFTPFPVYPNGFPVELIRQITSLTGRAVLGNKAASGTEIIAELGEEHIKTGALIVYTSADSVLQIAAHEEVVPLDELNRIASEVRTKICVGEHAVGRVITRPFTGTPGNFVRTPNRHDFSIQPPRDTVLDVVLESGRQVIGVGKISDIYTGRGISESHPTKSNDHGVQTLLSLVRNVTGEVLVMVNLVEFDSLYGHRNDCMGYARALQRFDGQLALVLPELSATDLLIITADHGCDPTSVGTDHTREFVPLIVYTPGVAGRDLGIRTTFADVAATITENFGLRPLPYGTSFLAEVKK